MKHVLGQLSSHRQKPSSILTNDYIFELVPSHRNRRYIWRIWTDDSVMYQLIMNVLTYVAISKRTFALIFNNRTKLWNYRKIVWKFKIHCYTYVQVWIVTPCDVITSFIKNLTPSILFYCIRERKMFHYCVCVYHPFVANTLLLIMMIPLKTHLYPFYFYYDLLLSLVVLLEKQKWSSSFYFISFRSKWLDNCNYFVENTLRPSFPRIHSILYTLSYENNSI